MRGNGEVVGEKDNSGEIEGGRRRKDDRRGGNP